jgi:hypothetical protein
MDSMGHMNHMDHSEAVQQMAAEKYLLNELPPDLRDAFEEHMFDCQECAFDIRAGDAFVNEAKIQLPRLPVSSPEPAARKQNASRSGFSWWRPLFASPLVAGPVFASLLIVIGYQNLVTYPALRTASNEPRLLPSVALHAGTRGGAHTVVEADHKQGVVILVDVPEQAAYASYAFDLYDPQGKLAWTHDLSSARGSGTGDGMLSLVIPGAGLRQGAYTLAVSGVSSTGQHTEVERNTFDIHFNE